MLNKTHTKMKKIMLLEDWDSVIVLIPATFLDCSLDARITDKE